MVHLVERNLDNPKVPGSRPASDIKIYFGKFDCLKIPRGRTLNLELELVIERGLTTLGDGGGKNTSPSLKPWNSYPQEVSGIPTPGFRATSLGSARRRGLALGYFDSPFKTLMFGAKFEQ